MAYMFRLDRGCRKADLTLDAFPAEQLPQHAAKSAALPFLGRGGSESVMLSLARTSGFIGGDDLGGHHLGCGDAESERNKHQIAPGKEEVIRELKAR